MDADHGESDADAIRMGHAKGSAHSSLSSMGDGAKAKEEEQR